MDNYIYAGEISRQGYGLLCSVIEPKSESCRLVLCTAGGDPDAAFRIARALIHHYPKGFSLLVPSICKSAGTLVAVGATELIICDQGELGPLDVQLSKPDELVERTSGLDIMQVLNVLREETLSSFRKYLLDVTYGTRISVKTSADMAVKLVTALFSPIYSQIDPIRLGEIQRAISIANHYGDRLIEHGKNVKPNGLRKLIMGYPSHSFVIDRREAKSIFKNVKSPTEEETSVFEICTPLLGSPFGEPKVQKIEVKANDKPKAQKPKDTSRTGQSS
jgi:hypothetical protein